MPKITFFSEHFIDFIGWGLFPVLVWDTLIDKTFLVLLLFNFVLDTHVMQFKGNHLFHLLPNILLRLRTDRDSSNIGIVFLFITLSLVSRVHLVVYLNIHLQLQHQLTRFTQVMLIEGFIHLVLFGFAFELLLIILLLVWSYVSLSSSFRFLW